MRYGCTKEELKIVRCRQDRATIVTAVACQPGIVVSEVLAVSEIWLYIWLQFGYHCVMYVMCVLKTIMNVCEL